MAKEESTSTPDMNAGLIVRHIVRSTVRFLLKSFQVQTWMLIVLVGVSFQWGARYIDQSASADTNPPACGSAADMKQAKGKPCTPVTSSTVVTAPGK